MRKKKEKNDIQAIPNIFWETTSYDFRNSGTVLEYGWAKPVNWIPISVAVFGILVYLFLSCFKVQTYLWHDSIILVRGEVLSHEISPTPPFFNYVPAPSQECERSCTEIASFTYFLLGFWNCSDNVMIFVSHFCLYLRNFNKLPLCYTRRSNNELLYDLMLLNSPLPLPIRLWNIT
jgi:hypothetical protein